MRIKTFYAKTMAEAMREIKAALGPDALLLSTREIRGRSRAAGAASGFEVVAACDDSTSADSGLECAKAATCAAAAPGAGGMDLVHKMQDSVGPHGLTYSPNSLRRTVNKTSHKGAGGRGHAPKGMRAAVTPAREIPSSDALSASLYRDLLDGGVDEWLVRKLLMDAGELVATGDQISRKTLIQALGLAAQALLPPSAHEDEASGRRIVAFVGPTGVGKTTTIAKLAARLALQLKKRVVLMTLDGYRIGAVEQLRTYAGLMGIPFRFVSQTDDLPEVVRQHDQRDYVLIDTAGRAPRDLDAIQDLAECLRRTPGIECHLVLSATTKPSDLAGIVQRFEICAPDHLLFTKLDETSTPGPMLNELVRTRKPVSYYSDGQRVPEDLHPASMETIMDIVLHRN